MFLCAASGAQNIWYLRSVAPTQLLYMIGRMKGTSYSAHWCRLIIWTQPVISGVLIGALFPKVFAATTVPPLNLSPACQA